VENFLSLKDLDSATWKQLLRASAEVKNHPGHFRQMLAGKSLVLVFEKPSLRTRLTFELGVKQLGGDAVYLGYQEAQLSGRESLGDVARNLERWFDCIVARTFSHEAVLALAEIASIPVVNALTDREHPCQALADSFTLMEKWGQLEGKMVAFVGDGNNVCTSLIHAAALSGMSFVAITPESHRPPPEVAQDFEQLSESDSGSYQWTDSVKGLEGADAVYTDTWVSMGQEEEMKERVRTFQAYQVTPEVMDLAGKEACFMHCLPAHRNQEVTDAVIDSPRSLVFEQAENRLHVQKALLLFLLAGKELSRYFQLEKWAAWKN
jgi:ornithine carbamoyltransferase